MARFSVVLDACALVPIVQADLLLRLAEADLFRPLWSEIILEETQSAIERIHPDLKMSGLAQRRIAFMDEAFDDASVDVWPDMYSSIELPDPDDRHVLAAAIQGRADLIVTNNLKDFPQEVLGHFDLSTQTPDEFFLNQLDLDPQQVMLVIQAQAKATENPVVTEEEILEKLRKSGAEKFADAARGQLWRISKARG